MPAPADTDVYVDVDLEEGLLFFVLCNDGALPATQVRVSFDRSVLGTDDLDVTTLGIFRYTEFLAPGKRIPVLIDRAHAYFARRQRSLITMKIAWRAGTTALSSVVRHDMRAYADLPQVRTHPDRRHISPR